MPLPPINTTSHSASSKRSLHVKSPLASTLLTTTTIPPPLRPTIITTALIDILAQGYVKSYQELFRLTHAQNSARTATIGGYSEKSVNAVFGNGDAKDVVANIKMLLINVEEAERANDATLQIHAHTRIGRFYTDMLEHDFAEQHFRAALVLSAGRDGLHVDAANLLSGVLTSLGRQLEALHVLESARHASAGAESTITGAMISILLQMSDEQTAAANYTEAGNYLAHAWDLASNSNLSESAAAEIMYRRGMTALALSQLGDATKLLEEYKNKVVAMKDVLGEAKACSSLARVSENKGDFTSAAAYLEEYLTLTQKQAELAPKSAEASRRLGLLYSKMGKFEESARFFESSLEHSESKEFVTVVPAAAASVQVGIARANALMPRLFELVKENDVAALLKWKSARELPDVVVAPAASI
ncbi:hypothetical protein SeLEV6574_g04199 [Synchytrium endobioticum]|uniref:Tetratricopeptide repeat protein 29 n=1 Tax=Synchytrium endobioticum TaxID=286115 RepID=A0A507D0G6_9FUNG|nr:hypothetical protein SeLEV6574_g04199 [Synchytrium endobioticum]